VSYAHLAAARRRRARHRLAVRNGERHGLFHVDVGAGGERFEGDVAVLSGRRENVHHVGLESEEIGDVVEATLDREMRGLSTRPGDIAIHHTNHLRASISGGRGEMMAGNHSAPDDPYFHSDLFSRCRFISGLVYSRPCAEKDLSAARHTLDEHFA
jgi:hypothetical protein